LAETILHSNIGFDELFLRSFLSLFAIKRERNETKKEKRRERNAKASGLSPRTPAHLKDLFDEFTHQTKTYFWRGLALALPRREKRVFSFWLLFLFSLIKKRKSNASKKYCQQNQKKPTKFIVGFF